MKLTPIESKKLQVKTWLRVLTKSTSEVKVCNYSYTCIFSGSSTTKTLIVFPDEIEARGIIAIDKPLLEVEMIDVIKQLDRASLE